MKNSFLSFLTLLLFFTSSAAAGSAVKGVRGTRKLQLSPDSDSDDKKAKKCKKFKEPKADPKIAGDPKAAKDPKAADPKLSDKDKDAKDAKDSKDAKDAKDSKDAKSAKEEDECLEWEDGDRDGSGGDVVSEPTFGSTGTSTDFQSINVDCDAIANGSGPTDTDYVSFSVNIDVLKDADSKLQSIYSAMEQEMQNKIAPRIAGCSGSDGSSQETSKIVNVDFGELEFDRSGCDSSLAKQAAELDGVCMASDVPVTVYFVGDFPESAKAKVEVAIEEHEWDVEGLLATSEVEVTQTGSSMGGDSGPSPGVFAGIGVAALAVLGLGGFMYYRKTQGPPLAKAELDTDEESSDDEKKTPEVKIMSK